MPAVPAESAPDGFPEGPPDPRGPAFPRHAAAATFTGVSARPLPCRSLVVGSADDPCCAPQTAAGSAAGWRADWHLAGAFGHLNSASGLGAWPHGRAPPESPAGE